MDEIVNELVALVANNGGSMSFRAIVAGVPFERRSVIPKALKQARVNGQLTQTVSLVDGVVVHQFHTA